EGHAYDVGTAPGHVGLVGAAHLELRTVSEPDLHLVVALALSVLGREGTHNGMALVIEPIPDHLPGLLHGGEDVDVEALSLGRRAGHPVDRALALSRAAVPDEARPLRPVLHRLPAGALVGAALAPRRAVPDSLDLGGGYV